MSYQQPTTTGYSYPAHTSLNTSHDSLRLFSSPFRSQPSSNSYNNINIPGTMAGSYNYNQSLEPFSNPSFNNVGYSLQQQHTSTSNNLPSHFNKFEKNNNGDNNVPSFSIEPVNTDLKPIHPSTSSTPSQSSTLPIPQSSSGNRYLHSPLEYTPTVSKLPFVPYGNKPTDPKIPFTAHSFESSSQSYHYNPQIYPHQQYSQDQQMSQQLSSQHLPLPQLHYPQISSTRSSSFSEVNMNDHGNVSLIQQTQPVNFSDDAVSAAIKAAEVSAAQNIGRKKRRTRKTCILTKREAEVAKIETFECPHCTKIFSRLYNLKSHLKTHSNEKPYNCSYCERKFARNHDRKRHELLHQGEKKFQCGGILNDKVTKWGCGKKFARADGLGRHFRTETGWLCIRPLMIEAKELEKKQLVESSNPNSELSSNDEIINKIIGRS